MDFLVGSFNHSSIYLLHFILPDDAVSDSATMTIVREHPALGGHSWLSLSKDKQYLYTTVWSPDGKPAIASYRVRSSGRDVQFLNAKHIRNLSGYVCNNTTHVFSVGGASGEVFEIEADGSIGQLVQELDFTDGQDESGQRGEVPHGDFGGLRHGAHSVDLSPDGKSLYVADIGRNCIWTYNVQHSRRGTTDPPLGLGTKHISPRSNDGPRHTWPHPSGKVLYSLQEHSSMVDVFAIADDGVTLNHKQGARIIPVGKECENYWADEVRYSTGPDPKKPRYLYASTRGLAVSTKGYVAAFGLREDGTLKSEEPLHVWETPTSGGLANAIEPAPWRNDFGELEFLAMTDSHEGLVFVLSFDGRRFREVSRISLGQTDDGKIIGAATAAWL